MGLVVQELHLRMGLRYDVLQALPAERFMTCQTVSKEFDADGNAVWYTLIHQIQRFLISIYNCFQGHKDLCN